MTDENRHFDNEPDLGVSTRFGEDLGRLFAPDQPIPTHVDRAVTEAARRHLQQPQRRLWWLKWTVPATAAAAILLTISAWWFDVNPTPPATVLEVSARPADIDLDGQVNILDAFTLARHIEAKRPVDQRWDLNGDGLIDRRDVDAIALAAVRLNKGV